MAFAGLLIVALICLGLARLVESTSLRWTWRIGDMVQSLKQAIQAWLLRRRAGNMVKLLRVGVRVVRFLRWPLDFVWRSVLELICQLTSLPVGVRRHAQSALGHHWFFRRKYDWAAQAYTR